MPIEENEARKIVADVLKEQNLYDLAEIYKKEHNIFRGTHKELPLHYTKEDLNNFFEGEEQNKKQVHWDRVTSKPSTYPPESHNHDDLYYLESEVDALLAAQNEFKELSDTPSSYVDQGEKGIRVKNTEDGLEFYTLVDTDDKVKVGAAGVADYLNEDYFERDVSNHIRIKQNTLLTGVDADKVDGIHGSAFLRNPATGALDMGGYYIGNCSYIRAVGGAADCAFGKDVAGIGRIYPDASGHFHIKEADNTTGNLYLWALYPGDGSYYLNSLIANNKVPDSDKLDGLHASDFLQTPMTQALDMGEYYIGNCSYLRTVGGAVDMGFGKDQAGLTRIYATVSDQIQFKDSGDNFTAIRPGSLVLGSYFLNPTGLVANNKVLDSDKVDGYHASDFPQNPMIAALDMGGYYIGNCSYIRTVGGVANAGFGKDVAGIGRIYPDASGHFHIKESDNSTGNLYLWALYPGDGSYYLNSLIANNKVPDSDKWDGYQFADYLNQAVKTASSPTFVGATIPKHFINRAGGTASGLSWYSSGYTAWAEYMAAAGQGSCGATGNITAPAGTIVTSWALRSFIENASTYGWTWEGGSSTGQPSVVAELKASSGLFYPHGGVKIGAYTLTAMTANNKVSDSDKVDGIHGTALVSTTYNTSLNADSRNSRGVTRLYRRDDDSDYSVQAHWTGTYWWLRGYAGDSFFAEAQVGYALNSDKLDGYHASLTGPNTIAFRDSNQYLYCSYLNCTSGETASNPTHYFVETGNDSWIRQMTPANFVAQLVLDGLMPKSGGIFTGAITTRDHGTGSIDEVVNVCYGTGNPPTASTTTIGTIYLKHAA